MKRLKSDQPTAEELRARAAAAEAAATEAERQASAARAEAASALADGDAQGALAARNRAVQHVAEAEQQRDLAAELARRAAAAERAEVLANYRALVAAAMTANSDAEAAVTAALAEAEAAMERAQSVVSAALEAAATAGVAFRRLPPDLVAEAGEPPEAVNPHVTCGNGVPLRFFTARPWRRF
jgi:SWI/SNF-related matrix-associated actin-dependent regulator 1 of chromatin subfamily A